jgi:transcriptional regulator with XRE-family HTH domain
MIEFDRELLDWFIGIVRKYMHLRGDLSQKDLAEEINVGISTLSRFLNQKIKDIDEQVIAKIVAFLQIPLHEIIDFVDEQSTPKFLKLVAYYKEESKTTNKQGDHRSEATQTAEVRIGRTKVAFESGERESSISEKFSRLSPRQKAYLSDFLDLDSEGRDVIVDIGNQLLRYFKQNRLSF